MASGIFVIRLNRLCFFSKIGVFDQERKAGNEFQVDFSVKLDASCFEKENLDSTASYADIYEIISSEMAREWKLLESVAVNIVRAVRQRYTMAGETTVNITKMSVPISGIQGDCSVEYREG